MKLFVGVTDDDWFRPHASKPHAGEVNFRRPPSAATFQALRCGEPFLFKSGRARSQHDNGMPPTRISMAVIVNLGGFPVECERVMPGVGPQSRSES